MKLVVIQGDLWARYVGRKCDVIVRVGDDESVNREGLLSTLEEFRVEGASDD